MGAKKLMDGRDVDQAATKIAVDAPDHGVVNGLASQSDPRFEQLMFITT
jgi:hypothetical protein